MEGITTLTRLLSCIAECREILDECETGGSRFRLTGSKHAIRHNERVRNRCQRTPGRRPLDVPRCMEHVVVKPDETGTERPLPRKRKRRGRRGFGSVCRRLDVRVATRTALVQKLDRARKQELLDLKFKPCEAYEFPLTRVKSSPVWVRLEVAPSDKLTKSDRANGYTRPTVPRKAEVLLKPREHRRLHAYAERRWKERKFVTLPGETRGGRLRGRRAAWVRVLDPPPTPRPQHRQSWRCRRCKVPCPRHAPGCKTAGEKHVHGLARSNAVKR